MEFICEHSADGLHITVPAGVKRITKKAFDQYRTGPSLHLKTITLPDSVTVICKGAFSRIKSLERVNIPEGVTEIRDGAFSGCISLKSIIIPESVTEIRDDTFNGCINLKSINIPNGITRIGNSAFKNCERLEAVIIPDGVTAIGDDAFAGCRSLKEVIIPDSVTSLGCWCFCGCSSLEKVSLPKSITEIGSFFFSDCCSLKSIVIPEGVKRIGYYAFSGCTSLDGVRIPDSVTFLGEKAFSDCASLTKITVPATVEQAGYALFNFCNNLKELYFLAGAENVLKKQAHQDIFCCIFYADTWDWEEECFAAEQQYPTEGFERIFIPGMQLGRLREWQLMIYLQYFLTCPELFGETERKKYIKLIKTNIKELVKVIIQRKLISSLRGLLTEKLLPPQELENCIELANSGGMTEILAMLLEYKNSLPPHKLKKINDNLKL